MGINFAKIIRVGKVSSTNPAAMTVRVTFPDEAGLVSDDLHVLCQGSKSDKDYWMPDVGEQVVCIFLPNGRNTGYCLGTFFSKTDAPPAGAGQTKRIIKHNGDLEIECTGNVRIKAANIYLNE